MKRRQLMKYGGLAVAGIVGLTACTSDDNSTNADDRQKRAVDGGSTDTQNTQTAEQTAKQTATQTASPEPTPTQSNKDVKLLSQEFYTADYGGFGVRGKAKNVSGEKLMSVTINTYYFDAEGTRFAQGTHIANEVQAGVTYQYDSSALTMEGAENVDHYEIDVEVMDF